MSSGIDEIYKTLLLIGKPREDITMHHRNLNRLISKLYDDAISGKVQKNDFKQSKKNYINQLYAKSVALHKAMDFASLKDDNLPDLLKTEDTFLKLSNFYRSAYYSFFYLGRAIMLECSDKDCSDHTPLWKVISDKIIEMTKESKRLENLIKAVAGANKPTTDLEAQKKTMDDDLVLFQLVDNGYEDLKEFRETSDYSLMEESRMKLANEDTLENVNKRVAEAISKWARLK